jgi:ubiquitin-conjugating enzyme E2 Z
MYANDAQTGIVCYDTMRKEDMRSHIEAVITAVEEQSPAYDPRTLVNPEAAKLYWGSAEDKKLYNRRLRRAVQDSAE